MTEVSKPLSQLEAWFASAGPVAIAVSGGVDSMTLAHASNRVGAPVELFHAVSPAVPAHATERVRGHAKQYGWLLQIVGAGEFDDPDYLRNPVNRCYFCKSNLYARIQSQTDSVICSGTNTDDLGDFRPGLGAAREQGVRHPFVECGIDKAGIRALATEMKLDDLAELPAQPCLASRVETGLVIQADALALIDELEQRVAQAIGPGDIRARLTRGGLRLELPTNRIEQLEQHEDGRLLADIARQADAAGHRFAGVGPYRRGSAFLHDEASS